MKAQMSTGAAAKLAAAAVLAAVSLLVTACFYMPGVSRGEARAGLVLPRYIAANTSSLALIVGGPGMNPIYATYPVGTTSATLSVPSGVARTFTLLANTPSVTFQGQTTTDLLPGETKEITLNPTLSASQIIVPDLATNRLIQISDMQGTGWTAVSGSTTAIFPYDVDFDDQGRVYVANNSSPSGIIRMNDITDTSLTALAGVTLNVRSIAMDRTHGLLYYTDGSNLWRIQVSPAPPPTEQINLTSLNVSMATVEGIAVDSDGFVYIANTSGSIPPSTILKINPNPATSPSIVTTYSDPATLVFPYDILVKGDYVYVSDPAAPKIVRLDKNLQFVDSLTGPASDPFLGPERFVAILNKPITVVDQNTTHTKARLVSFDDMTGAGWTTYGAYGTGQGQFEFYNSYLY